LFFTYLRRELRRRIRQAVFIALGILGSRPQLNTVLVATFALLLGINLARWVMWIWVA